MLKKNIRSQLFKSILCILWCIALPLNSYAYLDLGTGSYFIQLAAATLLAGLYTVKVFWKNIKSFFKKIFYKNTENNE